jgi:hypothetical protein
MSTKDNYIAIMKAQLDDLNSSMGEMEEQAKIAKEDVRVKCNAEMIKLRHQSQLVMEKFEELKFSGDGAWANLVAETEKVRDAFIHSFQDFKSQL